MPHKTKEADQAYRRAYRQRPEYKRQQQARKEYFRTYGRKWRLDNKERMLELNKTWAAKNREARNAYMREWNAANSEKLAKNARKRRLTNPKRHLLTHAKERAKLKGLEFSIDETHIVLNIICPVLGIPIVYDNTKQNDFSPTLDRTDNTKGYTPDNIAVISWRANHVKNDGTAEEHQAIADYMFKHVKAQ